MHYHTNLCIAGYRPGGLNLNRNKPLTLFNVCDAINFLRIKAMTIANKFSKTSHHTRSPLSELFSFQLT